MNEDEVKEYTGILSFESRTNAHVFEKLLRLRQIWYKYEVNIVVVMLSFFQLSPDYLNTVPK